MLQETGCCGPQVRATRCVGLPDGLNQLAASQRVERCIAGHAADRFDRAASGGLTVGDDRDRLERRLGEAIRSLEAQKSLNKGGRLRCGDQANRRAIALNADATARVFLLERVERLLYGVEGAVGRVGERRYRRRLFSGKQQRFNDERQIFWRFLVAGSFNER